MKAAIFANGEINNYEKTKEYLKNAELIICADGGLRHVDRLQLIPDFVLGDFDSVDPSLLQKYREFKKPVPPKTASSQEDTLFSRLVTSHVEFITFPTDKDYTDLELALVHAAKAGVREALIFGGMGGRPDHFFANALALITAKEQGIKAALVGDQAIIELGEGKFEKKSKPGATVSLIPISPVVEGVTTHGLKYPLKNESLRLGEARGVSNVTNGDSFYITIKKGQLLIITLL